MTGNERDWSRRFLDDERKGRAAQQEAEGKGCTGRKSGTRPSHPLGEYSGRYEHPGYGTVRVEQAGKGLSVRYGASPGRRHKPGVSAGADESSARRGENEDYERRLPRKLQFQARELRILSRRAVSNRSARGRKDR